MLNVGVIGLGNMGRFHVKTYSSINEANLVCVCDVRPEVANFFADEYKCKGYTDIDEMFANEELDAVSIAAPTALHYDIALKVIDRGINLLIEKPIAETTKKTELLIKAAEKKNVKLMVGHIERFNPAVQKLKQLVSKGILGDIVSLICRRVSTFPPQIKDANVVIDLAVHDIDIFSWLLEEEPIAINKQASNAIISDREDYADLFIKYKKASGFIQVNWITPIKVRKLFITGTKGYAELDYIDQSLILYPSSYTKETDNTGNEFATFQSTEPQSIQIEKTMPLTSELSHFLECIKLNKTPLTNGNIGKTALENVLSLS
jgi:UDP-N-acetylglucosamine 3-dehydrogenase